MIYVISKSACGDYNVRDIQCNANWDCCPYSDYALIPDDLVEGILDTQGYCDIVLNDEGTMVVSFTANEIPEIPIDYPNPSVDCVIAQGEINGWNYRKWNSGVAECWTPNLGLEYFNPVCLGRAVELPFTMVSMVASMTIVNAGGYDCLNGAFTITYSTTNIDEPLIFSIMKENGNFTDTDYVPVAIHITGRWK